MPECGNFPRSRSLNRHHHHPYPTSSLPNHAIGHHRRYRTPPGPLDTTPNHQYSRECKHSDAPVCRRTSRARTKVANTSLPSPSTYDDICSPTPMHLYGAVRNATKNSSALTAFKGTRNACMSISQVSRLSKLLAAMLEMMKMRKAVTTATPMAAVWVRHLRGRQNWKSLPTHSLARHLRD